MIQQFTDNLRQRYRASPLPAFLSWWSAELATLIPGSVRRRLMPPKPALWLVPSPGGDLRVWRVGDEPQVLDVFGAGEDLDLLRVRWREILSAFEDGRPEVRLCLPDDHVLALPVELPMAVENNLSEALGYQIDQLTPFRAEQVLFDHAVVRHDVAHGRIHVALRVVPQEQVDPLLERLRAIGIVAHAVDTLQSLDPPKPEGFNLLPESRRPHYVHARARMNAAFAGVLLVVLALIMAQSLILRERSVVRLEAAAERLRDEAREVAELQSELEESLLAANFLAERRDRQPAAVELLAEVTRRLPDDIWLQRFQLQDGELTVQGLTEGSQRVVGLLGESPLLESPEIRGMINIDPATGKERFTTTAAVVSAPVDEAQGDDS
ncbi:MAG: PilN domain-containing protein [Wenzhouxiangellaceae bacterium]|nr:PilN domain-containing protein [Wenzhouxiangellaceae bacterium]